MSEKYIGNIGGFNLFSVTIDPKFDVFNSETLSRSAPGTFREAKKSFLGGVPTRIKVKFGTDSYEFFIAEHGSTIFTPKGHFRVTVNFNDIFDELDEFINSVETSTSSAVESSATVTVAPTPEVKIINETVTVDGKVELSLEIEPTTPTPVVNPPLPPKPPA